jgi:hypothetical protein
VQETTDTLSIVVNAYGDGGIELATQGRRFASNAERIGFDMT